MIDSSTNYQCFKTLALLLSNVEMEHFTPQWNAGKLNVEYIFRESFAIYAICKHSLDCNKTSFLLLFEIISTSLKLWDIIWVEKNWKSFILSFSKIWSVSSGNKLLTCANLLIVIRFRGGNVGTWLGLMRVNTEGGSLALSLPQLSFVG